MTTSRPNASRVGPSFIRAHLPFVSSPLTTPSTAERAREEEVLLLKPSPGKENESDSDAFLDGQEASMKTKKDKRTPPSRGVVIAAAVLTSFVVVLGRESVGKGGFDERMRFKATRPFLGGGKGGESVKARRRTSRKKSLRSSPFGTCSNTNRGSSPSMPKRRTTEKTRGKETTRWTTARCSGPVASGGRYARR